MNERFINSVRIMRFFFRHVIIFTRVRVCIFFYNAPDVRFFDKSSVSVIFAFHRETRFVIGDKLRPFHIVVPPLIELYRSRFIHDFRDSRRRVFNVEQTVSLFRLSFSLKRQHRSFRLCSSVMHFPVYDYQIRVLLHGKNVQIVFLSVLHRYAFIFVENMIVIFILYSH